MGGLEAWAVRIEEGMQVAKGTIGGSFAGLEEFRFAALPLDGFFLFLALNGDVGSDALH